MEVGLNLGFHFSGLGVIRMSLRVAKERGGKERFKLFVLGD